MFERFTDRARRVVALAQEEARLLQHTWIGTEHILLGLLDVNDGLAAVALDALGISLDEAREKVIEMVGPQGTSVTIDRPPFTPRAKKVLELSLREALQLGHNYIGTEHLLLGLIREGEGIAALTLQGLGADLLQVRQEVIRLLGDPSAGDPSSERSFRTLVGAESFGPMTWPLQLTSITETLERIEASLAELIERVRRLEERG